jgi:hypothetical protein
VATKTQAVHLHRSFTQADCRLPLLYGASDGQCDEP